ncbi:unnamed protein product [Aphanomyces euteiches]|uniref:Uncharacterized protein n=1 Tax=Aphanomyces euteiches TaxID=100861 RepID=A0A6G0WGT5_9STRA|nr:hypothetical protein Ae201684_015380 [Aphanomyces euteiches]KAH9097594.1 hypothetical protein Ae201684P_001070 [Aphanomyces euteiches]KAH9155297.1 hypothetical protein AeRB84_002719 [Aphanomyces euteiches]
MACDASSAATASLQVVSNPNLFRCIASFQDGLYLDLLPRYAAWKLAMKVPSASLKFLAPLLITSLTDVRFVLHAAIARCDIACIQRLVQCRPYLVTSEAMDCASRHGYIDLVRHFHNHLFPCSRSAMDIAAKHGHLDVVVFLHENRQEGCTEKAIEGAAEAGHLQVVQYLHAHRFEATTHRAMDYAARNGHFDVVQFLHFNRREGCSSIAMDFAASHGHLAIVEFLHTHRTEGCSTYAMDGAARNGHIDVVRFLFERRTEGCSRKAYLHATIHNPATDLVAMLGRYHHRITPTSLHRAKQSHLVFKRARPRRYFLASVQITR